MCPLLRAGTAGLLYFTPGLQTDIWDRSSMCNTLLESVSSLTFPAQSLFQSSMCLIPNAQVLFLRKLVGFKRWETQENPDQVLYLGWEMCLYFLFASLWVPGDQDSTNRSMQSKHEILDLEVITWS